MKKTALILLFTFPQLLFAQTSRADASGGLLESLKNLVSQQNISGSTNLFNADIGQGLYIDGRYRVGSEPSVNGKYSRIDAFHVSGNALLEELIGKSLPLNPELSVQRELIFIRQFDSRHDSLYQLPYFLSRIPKNTTKALELAEGTFVSYRAPMVVSLGDDLINELQKIAKGRIESSVKGRVFASGEFDIHVFRMKDNMVRVKLFAMNQKGASASARISVFSLVGGPRIISRLFDWDILSIGFEKSTTKLVLADYVFNLNHAESRDLYDKVIGQKYKMSDFPGLSVVPNISNEKLENRLFAHLDEVDRVVNEDQNLKLNDRRVVRIFKSRSAIKSAAYPFRFNVQFVKIVNKSTWSNGQLELLDDHDQTRATYRFKGHANQSERGYNWLGLSRRVVKTNYSGNLIMKVDTKTGALQEFSGFNWIHRYEDSNFKSEDFALALKQIEPLIPEKLRAGIEIPQWTTAKNNSAYIEREIFVNKVGFKNLANLTAEQIKKAFNEVLANTNHLESLPYGLSSLQVTEDTPYTDADRIRAYNKRDYVNAYSWDVAYMASYLVNVLNSKLTTQEREAEFDKISYQTPVFYEIGALAIIKMLPPEQLEESVVTRLRMSAQNQNAFDQCFPNANACGEINIFREVDLQSNLVTDRSFNIRHYMNEKAEIYTLPEIMIQHQE